MSETGPYENPLVPNKKLRKMYTAIVEARLLDEHIANRQHKMKPRNRMKSIRGQEACRVSTAIELQPGDLISDAQSGLTMNLLFGAKPGALLRHLAANASNTKDQASEFAGTANRYLPWIEDASDRLNMAMGAALTFKTLKQPNIVVAYVDRTEVSKGIWRQTLALSAKLTLPIIFVVLPETDRKKTDGGLNICAKARSAGIPGIPVDANDAVALYRVSQESIGRARGGDGAVLIDCIAGLPTTPSSGGADDPVLHMKSFLIGRKVCSEAWANHAGDAFRRKLAVNKKPAK